jgi:PAS domain-containing protein
MARMDTATGDRRAIAPPRPASQPFGDYGPAVTCASALILVLAISVIDKLTGYDLQIGIVHLVPVAMVTWAVGRTAGFAFAVLAVAVWMTMFRGALGTRAQLYFYWDAAVLAGTLLAFVLIVGRLREALRASELGYLDELPAPAYVLDEREARILYANAAFREVLGARSVEELARYPAIESSIRWGDARRAKLRILTV